jgi:ADP-heptose:LPS heptosyltransferase
VGYHLSAFQPAKLWPVERFVQVARYLAERHAARVLVVGSQSDLAQAEAFSGALAEPALIATGRTALPQTAALLERCRLFIGNDSGPAHLAAAVRTPAVVLFGPTDPDLWRPYGARVIRAPRACDPRCNSRTCAVPQRHCLADITADQVIEAAEQLLVAPPPR